MVHLIILWKSPQDRWRRRRVLDLDDQNWLEYGRKGRETNRYKWVYRIEKVGSELTAAEVAEHHELVVRAERRELGGIIKHDAMKAVRKAECSTKPITSQLVDGC